MNPIAHVVDRTVVSAYVLAMAVFAVVGAVGFRSATELGEYTVAVADRRATLRALYEVLAATTDAETGMRGYLVTADPRFLDPWNGSEKIAVRRADELRVRFAGDPDTMKSAEELDRLVTRRYAILADGLRLAREQGLEAARAQVASGEGKRVHDRLRVVVDELERAADAALRTSEARAQSAAAGLRGAIAAGIALALVFGGLATLRLLGDLRRLRETSDALARARDLAQDADRHKSAFLATMSHELRTPLNSILGFVGVLQQELPGPLNDEQRKQLAIVRTSARHLLALINDILDLSRIEAGQLAIERGPCDVGEIVARVGESLRPQAEAKGVVLDVRPAAGATPADGDARRVEQILLNLAGNAVKFTEAGRVVLAIEPPGTGAAGATPAGSRVRVRVEDTGPGIDEADLARIFEPFEQGLGGLARRHDGTGLGLAISRRLATLMGGTIDVASRPGHGSVFTLDLPASDEPVR